MYPSTLAAVTWPQAAIFFGIVILVISVLAATIGSWVELRKTRIVAAQEDDLRQLVHRYEQLAESTMDAQQRVAADVSELRSRTSSIEQILRTVE
jgi:hypothetical protein